MAKYKLYSVLIRRKFADKAERKTMIYAENIREAERKANMLYERTLCEVVKVWRDK